jgi:hypothetical protein
MAAAADGAITGAKETHGGGTTIVLDLPLGNEVEA